MGSHPTSIGKYRVDGVIGGGGMGMVYRAFDPVLEVPVAIKVIRGGAEMKRFYVEAKSTASMRQCPNIVTVYDFGEQDGNPYLVMELLEGISLENIIKNRTPLSVSEKLRIVVDVLNGLSYAHERNIIHRDIKPANVIVLNDGMAKIVDFGIARIGDTTGVTNPNTIVGTLEYMSPEAFLGKKLDSTTDIWSTAVMLYQLLTGRSPFKMEGENNPAPVIHRVIHEPPPPIEDVIHERLTEFNNILARGLAKKREERYSSAKEFSLDLLQVQQQLKEEDAARYFQEGQEAVRQEEWERARRLFDEAVKIDPNNTTARRWLHQVTERLRMEQRKNQVWRLQEEANAARVGRRFDEALTLIEEAIHLDGTNQELQALRAAVENDKNMQAKLQTTLENARKAFQKGQLSEAAKAVQEVLVLSPQDTQARTLDNVIRKKIDEQERQQQFRKLLEQARKQIAQNDLAGAEQTVHAAQEIDSTSPDLSLISTQLREAQQRIQRDQDLKRLNREIEAAFEADDYGTALAKADQGLKMYPGEKALLDLRALAEEQYAAQSKKKYLTDQINAANKCIQQHHFQEARSVIEQALFKYPGEGVLETLRADVMKKLAAADEEEQKTRVLQMAQVESQRKKEILEKLQQALTREHDPERQLHFVEEALKSSPNNEFVMPLLQTVKQRRDWVANAVAQARTLEAAGDLAGALGQWRAVRRELPDYPPLEGEIARIEQAEERANAPKPMPDFSATTVMSSGAAARAAPVKSPDQEKTIVVPPKGKKAAAPAAAAEKSPVAKAAPKPAYVPPPEEKSKMPLIIGGVVAVVIVAAVIGYFMRSGGGGAVAIKVSANPPDAQIQVDGQACPAPCEVKLNQGETKTVRASKDGYDVAEQKLTDASVNPFEIKLKEAGGKLPPPAVTGKLTITANVDGFSVLIDGVSSAVATGKSVTVTHGVGSANVSLQRQGYKDSAPQSVSIGKDAEAKLDFMLAKEEGLGRPYLVVTGTRGAKVQIDRKLIGEIGPDGTISVPMEPGNRDIQVEMNGFSAFSTRVSAKEGETKRVAANLKPLPPNVESFASSAGSIQPGQQAELKWQTGNASEVTIEPGIGVVSPDGSRQVTPDKTTTYTLTARNQGLTKTSTVTINVTAHPVPASIGQFLSGADTIQKGQSVRLIWDTANANDVSIDQGVGSVPPSGAKNVKPDKTTTYTLTAKGPGGAASPKTVTVTVEEPKVVVEKPAQPEGPDEIDQTVQRFARAYRSMSVDELVKVWPTISKSKKSALEEAFKAARAINIEFSRCSNKQNNGATASVSCMMTATYTTKDGKVQAPQSSSVQFRLKKSGDTFVVEDTIP